MRASNMYSKYQTRDNSIINSDISIMICLSILYITFYLSYNFLYYNVPI